jgi:hypothetical protein
MSRRVRGRSLTRLCTAEVKGEKNGMVVLMSCTAWSNGDDLMYPIVSLVLGVRQGVQERTQGDIRWMVRAKTHWI